MYTEKHPKIYQMSIDNFIFSYGDLAPDNRWVKLRSLIPWSKIEVEYAKLFSDEGAPATDVQIALGALILQSKLQCTDRDLVNHVRENPYMPYFLGLKEFSQKPPCAF